MLEEDRMIAVQNHRDSPLFSDKEKLVMDYAEEVTKKAGGVDHALLTQIQAAFSPPEIVELTMTIGVFQVYNRCNDILGADIDLPGGPEALYQNTFKKP